MARRGGIAGAAYLAASLIVLATLFTLNRQGDANLLRQVLAIHFIATLAAGLEPATAKAAALAVTEAALDLPSRRTIVAASGIKALLAAPGLALVWRLSDPAMDPRLLILTPMICVAGFAATDLRVLFDLRGRHAAAIWIKQGSLGGGLIILAALAVLGVPLLAALAASTLARLGLVLALLVRSPSGRDRNGGPNLTSLMRDSRWLALAGASVIAAAGGSADRVLGLRFLSPDAWAGYFALYEVLSKFWFIPYVATPVIFARAAVGRDARAVTRAAVGFTVTSGVILTVGVGVVLWLAPGVPRAILGSRLGGAIPDYAIIAFAAAVALNSLAQIRIAELQGRGAAHRAFAIMAVSALVTTGLFYVAVRGFGAAGLLCAWLAKSVFELGLAYAPFRRDARSAVSPRGWAAPGDAGM